MPGLDVLGEQHDAQLGWSLAELARGPGAVVGASGGIRTSMIGEVRRASLDRGLDASGVAAFGDDLVPGVSSSGARPSRNSTESSPITIAHGSTASTSVPRPGGLRT